MADMKTPTQSINTHIARSRELGAKATEGPWSNYYTRHEVFQSADDDESEIVDNVAVTGTFKDGDFIAAARTLLPQYVEALSIALEALNKLPTYNRGEPEMKAEALSKIAAILSPP